MGTIIFEKKPIKKPMQLKKIFFLIYCLRAIKIESATSIKIDTEIVVFLPPNAMGYVTSIFRGDEINEIYCKKQRLWTETLNKSFEETVEIKRNRSLGFLFIEPEYLKFKYETAKKKKKADQKTLSTYKPKTKEATWRFS